MPTTLTEDTVEYAALDWLVDLGYSVVQGGDLTLGESAAKREDYGEGNIRKALNEQIGESAILEEAIRGNLVGLANGI